MNSNKLKQILCAIFFIATNHNVYAEQPKIDFEPDINGNSVRDDIDVYIKKTYSKDPELVMFLTEYARTYQSYVRTYDDKEQSKNIYKIHEIMFSCLYKYRPTLARSTTFEIKARLLNTVHLYRANMKADKNQTGIHMLPTEAEVNAYCSKYFK